MEVAGQWRQQWAGAAEYGKVVDGGGAVQRTARALEVMHASGPGARVRVMRAAFHSSGPLSSSYLLHSSTRRIFSSGADILLSPSLVSKPLELSSTPLDVSDTGLEGEGAYKVTEPDDTDISEPSKWKSSSSRGSFRRASEESSSTDNASLVDSGSNTLFARTSQQDHSTKTSLTSEARNAESRTPSFKSKLMSSPLMKISEHTKCLESSISKLNINKTRDDWHDRRKSYGFEDSPSNNIRILSDDEKIGMESSTDSGICKSTEIVNIPVERYKPYDVGEVSDTDNNDNLSANKQETFRDWLAKNRSSAINNSDFSSVLRNTQRSDDTVTTSINLKALGKISIALPASALDSANGVVGDQHNSSVNIISDISDRKYKKVEFCKTELHFAAESGKVNIIETDEKPPSSNDFRKRRSAFVPIKKQVDRPITLFGGSNLIETSTMDKKEICFNDTDYMSNGDNYEKSNIDLESDSSVKSILKNRIPKPKPYLLGENTVFGETDSSEGNVWGVRLRRTSEEIKINKTPISILNESLKEENRFVSMITHELDQRFKRVKDVESDVPHDTYKFCRGQNKSPVDYINISDITTNFDNVENVTSTETSEQLVYDIVDRIHNHSNNNSIESNNNNNTEVENDSTNSVREKLKKLQMSPILQNRIKTRHLRQNELSYFGVPTQNGRSIISSSPRTNDQCQLKSTHFFTNSSCDSEKTDRKAVKSLTRVPRELPLYQNLPIKSSFTPVPAPRIIKHKVKSTSKKSSIKKDVKEQTTHKYSSDDSNDYNTDEDDNKQRSKSPRKSKRALETINETRIVSQGSVRKTPANHKGSEKEIKRRGDSPSINRVETPKISSKSRTSLHKISSNESVVRSRESSFEDGARLVIVKPRRSKKVDKLSVESTDTNNVEAGSTPLVNVEEKEEKNKFKYTLSHSEHKMTTSNTKTPEQSNTLSKATKLKIHEKSNERSLQRMQPDQKQSDSRTEHKHRSHSPDKERNNKQNETTIAENSTRRKKSSKPDDVKQKESIRKKEYILNYDDKNGTFSSISKNQGKHTSSRKREKNGSTLKKIEEKPKETTRKSRVISLEVKSPMLPSQDLHRRTRSARRDSPRRKHREESSK